MASGVEEFVDQLRQLGVQVTSVSGARVIFPFLIETGRFAGQTVNLGLEVPPEFPRTPPSGPHLSPRLLPLNPSAAAHPERVADSPFGQDFEYLSRPYQNWGKDGANVSAYLAFVRHLFATS